MLAEAGMPGDVIKQALGALLLEVVAFDEAQAYETGLLQPSTRAAGLSMGDRCCLTLARILGLPAVTADRRWATLVAGMEVREIR